jgi:hypothetical protein
MRGYQNRSLWRAKICTGVDGARMAYLEAKRVRNTMVSLSSVLSPLAIIRHLVHLESSIPASDAITKAF